MHSVQVIKDDQLLFAELLSGILINDAPSVGSNSHNACIENDGFSPFLNVIVSQFISDHVSFQEGRGPILSLAQS